MDIITYKMGTIPGIGQLKQLYEDAEWEYYLKDLKLLEEAYINSLEVISAWDGEQLVGIIRAVGDGLTILYIQDILVLETHQRRGIGRQLLSRMLNTYAHVRQTVLMTDNRPETVAFYDSMGFLPAAQYHGVAYVKYRLGGVEHALQV